MAKWLIVLDCWEGTESLSDGILLLWCCGSMITLRWTRTRSVTEAIGCGASCVVAVCLHGTAQWAEQAVSGCGTDSMEAEE
jgi:hypothetical protein